MKRKNKKLISYFMIFSLVFLSGCGDPSSNKRSGGTGAKTVQDVLDERTKSESTTEITTEITTETKNETETETEVTTEASTAKAADVTEPKTTDATDGVLTYTADQIDYDTTNMSKDMVYATIYNFMMDPISHSNEIIKIKGNLITLYDEKTGQNYHYCLIKDAMACCQQGMEFVWDDGSKVYPDDYPPQDTEIIITGRFETYKDSPDDKYTYCRLSDAVLEVVN